jgi:uncharacterized protein with HEPN domain
VSSREWRLRVEDILEAIERIEQYTHELTSESFASNMLVVDAVVRNFTVIGEAARNVPPEIEAHYALIPWAKMRGMRNIVVHAYFNVDASILWQTARQDLPPLVPALRAILADPP